MTPSDPIDIRLAALRAEMQSVTAPAALEQALAAQFRRMRPADAPRARPRLWWMPPLALAATVALVSWMVRTPLDPLPARVATAPAEDPGPFLALKPLERIALEPGTTIVATEFPRALLACAAVLI